MPKRILRIRKSNIFYFLLISLDSCSVVIALLLAYSMRDKGIFRHFLYKIQPLSFYVKALPEIIILLLIIFTSFQLYEPKQRLTKISETYSIAKAVTLWMLLIMASSYLYKYQFSRTVTILLSFFTVLIIVFNRLLVRKLQTYATNAGFATTNILIVGTGKQAKNIAKKLTAYRSLGLRFIGFVDSDKKKQVVGSISSLNKLVKQYRIHEIYIADPSLSHEQILRIVAKAPPTVRFKITTNIFDLITGDIDISNLDSIPSLELGKIYFPFWKRIYKRIFDIVISLVGLLLTCPLWILIILAIKFDSPGPAIFTQKRVGFHGKSFLMYKFRTMYKETAAYSAAPKSKNDKRITRVGKWLRRSSLDESPQLINVLKGEMSIVGPRPEMAFIVKQYNMWQKRRLAVKPGLTGLWQILGRKDLPLTENMEYDFYYINNQSLLLDLVIIAKTIPLVIKGKGAY